MQKEIPRERWLSDAAVMLSPICLFHISCFHPEKKHLTEDRTEKKKRQKEERRFAISYLADLISAKTWNNLWHSDKQSNVRTNYNPRAIDGIPNNDWRLVRPAGKKRLTLLHRCCKPGLHLTRKTEEATNAPLGAEMNLRWAVLLTVDQLVRA